MTGGERETVELIVIATAWNSRIGGWAPTSQAPLGPSLLPPRDGVRGSQQTLDRPGLTPMRATPLFGQSLCPRPRPRPAPHLPPLASLLRRHPAPKEHPGGLAMRAKRPRAPGYRARILTYWPPPKLASFSSYTTCGLGTTSRLGSYCTGRAPRQVSLSSLARSNLLRSGSCVCRPRS